MGEAMLHSVAGVRLLVRHRVAGDSARVTRPPELNSAVGVVIVSHGGAQGGRELPVLLVIVPTPAPGCGGVVAIFTTSLDWSHAQSIDTLLARLLTVMMAGNVSRRRHLVTTGGDCPRVAPGLIYRQTRRMHHAPGGRVT